ncbi:unnamed protein product [Adineta ricciae]|uniref:GRIP domain-containing protein n=1 Tax=Adineta ricciae TaxID=249248 RepID=A0A814C3B3_ADIRI|nr:unnamed protein product [Adineta ricciae]
MSSKSELTKTIENQQSRITRLEQRFADLFTAYKNLQKEKEVLESTVRVLSTAASTVEPATTDNDGNASATENVESGAEGENSQPTVTEHQTLQEKLQTLQQNVTAIAEQKNHMERMFQTDKRKLKAENEELYKQLEEAKAENIIIKEKLDNEIKDLKNSLGQSQRDHGREVADCKVITRELQTLLCTERTKSETLEHQYDECRAKVVTLETQFDNLKKQYNALNNQYQAKLNELKDKDLVHVEELKRSKEKIAELIGKLNNLETKYTEQLRTESKRNELLEKKLNEASTEQAQKMSTTETQIAELSEQIGIIEKQRAQDQMVIQRLKERIAQLDMENSLLTKVSSTSIEQDDVIVTDDDTENHYDLDTLLKRISKLKVLIRMANDRFGQSLTIEDVLNIDREISSGAANSSGGNLSSENNKVLHSKCHEEIERLKAELEKYRNKTVAAFKAKAFKDTNTSKEHDDLRNQIDQLREKLANSQSLYNVENERHAQVVEKLESCLTNIREQHRHEMDQFLARKRTELNELECELEKQRERTMRLLSEKDRELETLRKQPDLIPTLNKDTSPSTVSDLKEEKHSEPTTIIGELFPRELSTSTIGGPMSPLPTADSNNILYFIQEQQLREQELMSLRKQRYELEMTIRDIHKKYSFEISQLQATNEQLNDDLEHIKLSTQRKEVLTKNEHNIDYIKNVFYHYLLANDTQVKHTMANALMTILHFSAKEKAKIENQKTNNTLTPGGWFTSK